MTHASTDVLLTTERLVLRAVTETDLDALHALYNDPEVMRYLNGGAPISRETFDAENAPRLLASHPATGTRSYWAAEERATGDLLGWFLFRPEGPRSADGVASAEEIELGYRLARSAWGRGYTTEGGRALVDHGFAHSPTTRSVVAIALRENVASWRVMEKCGLVYQRTYVDDQFPPIEGVSPDAVEYRLTRDQWQARRTG